MPAEKNRQVSPLVRIAPTTLNTACDGPDFGSLATPSSLPPSGHADRVVCADYPRGILTGGQYARSAVRVNHNLYGRPKLRTLCRRISTPFHPTARRAQPGRQFASIIAAIMSIALESARQQMVEQQVRTWEVLDPSVLHVLGAVHRENFVPAPFRNVAFADSNVPLGHGQVMLAPKIDGKILQALAVTKSDQVLDVGTGSGFLAACLGRLAEHVRTVEIFPDLAERAQANLHAAAANNVLVETADAFKLVDEERFDAIAVTGSLPSLDRYGNDCFTRALKVGGRLFAIVGLAPVMTALKITRIGRNEWKREDLFETVVPPLVNAARPSGFVF